MNKFILVKDKKEGFILRYANTDFHKNMVCNGEEVFGGGMFDFNDNDTVMTLYGKSDDFGVPRWLDIKETGKKIHADEDLDGISIRWLSGYGDNFEPIYLNFTDMFEFDYF